MFWNWFYNIFKFILIFLRLKKSKRLNKNSLCNYDYVFLQIGGGIGVGGTLWALSKTNYSYLTGTSAGVYMLMISVVLLLLTGVVGFVGVLRHNKPVMGSVSHFLILTVLKSLSNIYLNQQLVLCTFDAVYLSTIRFVDISFGWWYLDLY